MKKNMTFHRKKVWLVFLLCAAMMLGLVGRLIWLMGFRSDYYYEKAQDLHERERDIKAARGKILDAAGKVLADNKTVCTISVCSKTIPYRTRQRSSLSEHGASNPNSLWQKNVSDGHGFPDGGGIYRNSFHARTDRLPCSEVLNRYFSILLDYLIRHNAYFPYFYSKIKNCK